MQTFLSVLFVVSGGAAKSHFVVVQTSCLLKIGLQAGRLHHNIWIITVLFSLFAASSVSFLFVV